MKFKDMKYTRPDVPACLEAIDKMLQDVKNAADGAAVAAAYKEFGKLIDDIGSQFSIAHIRHTVDTRDEFYDGENTYIDQNAPLLGNKELDFYRAILASPHRQALADEYGGILLEIMDNAAKGSDDRALALQQEANALESEYQRLYASAQIPFRDKVLTVAQLGPYMQDTDRATRKEAFEAGGGFFDSKREELDDLYDKLVKNRVKQAETLGYESFIPLADVRLSRLGYTRADIAACRAAVVKHVVPAAAELKKMQAARLGVDDFRYYDNPLDFPDGNAKPTGTPEEILAAGQTMYRGLSPETAQFIDVMMEADLFDVLATPGKAPGGYCTQIPNEKVPFIFSNFNGTAGDVDVLTHEAGHAFAAWLAYQAGLPGELRNPGYESCEIHSMSMEFLTADYHHLFFGSATDKYTLSHAADSLCFMPYGCKVDDFQEHIYREPNLTPAQRNELWLELSRQYTPWENYEGMAFYGRGAGWQRQLHIYTSPFYYIDYVLAQAVALQFFLAHNKDKADAWQRYLTLTRKAGTSTYPELVRSAGFVPPFEESALAGMAPDVLAWCKAHPLSK